jgi:signal transduction histidine kinase
MPVGTIEVSSSLRPILIRTALVALLSTFLGSIIYYLIRILPIRSVQKAEEQLQHYARELEETNVDLQSFIFSLSHDLRTPLVTMKGFAGELAHALKEHEQMIKQQLDHFQEQERKRIEETLQDEIPETLGFIDMAADKMSNMISGVLQLSQVYQQTLKPQVLDMDKLVHTVLDRFQDSIKRRNVKLHRESLPALIADRVAMEEIMGHILDNAIKYLLPDRPGMVEISSRRIEQETVFSIRDNGRGIAQEDLPKIFGLFRRAGQQSILGEGMGLVYVKALVRRHNGRIWCESTVGSGTTISFAIPLKTPIGQFATDKREETTNHDEPAAGDHSSGRG